MGTMRGCRALASEFRLKIEDHAALDSTTPDSKNPLFQAEMPGFGRDRTLGCKRGESRYPDNQFDRFEGKRQF